MIRGVENLTARECLFLLNALACYEENLRFDHEYTEDVETLACRITRKLAEHEIAVRHQD